MGHVVKRPYKEGVGEKPTTKKPLGIPSFRYNRMADRLDTLTPRNGDDSEDGQTTKPHKAIDKNHG